MITLRPLPILYLLLLIKFPIILLISLINYFVLINKIFKFKINSLSVIKYSNSFIILMTRSWVKLFHLVIPDINITKTISNYYIRGTGWAIYKKQNKINI